MSVEVEMGCPRTKKDRGKAEKKRKAIDQRMSKITKKKVKREDGQGDETNDIHSTRRPPNPAVIKRMGGNGYNIFRIPPVMAVPITDRQSITSKRKKERKRYAELDIRARTPVIKKRGMGKGNNVIAPQLTSPGPCRQKKTNCQALILWRRTGRKR